MTDQKGEGKLIAQKRVSSKISVDTFNVKIHIEWDPDAEVTPIGQRPFFIQYLKYGQLFTPWVKACPLRYNSNNAPEKVDVLGSFLLSILAGHNRYAHMTSLLSDRVNAKQLGMNKVVSDDSARRALKKIEEGAGIDWLQHHLHYCFAPLLQESWILDIETTVKPLYGHQQGAEIGYNPHKPGRPSHPYHIYMMANLRLVLDVEVQSGSRTAAKYSAPGLWALLERIRRRHWPKMIRGDCDWGNEGILCEMVALPDSPAQLKQGQQQFAFIEAAEDLKTYEYAVLITSLSDEVLTISQHYRDRADCENVFDEMKHQWGWGGFVTQDIKRCRLMACMIALVYNWWNLFVRLAVSDKHLEAITSRPLLLYGVGKLSHHSGKQTLTITQSHGRRDDVIAAYKRISRFFSQLKQIAPQLSPVACWYRILSEALKKYLNGRQLYPPDPIMSMV